MPDSDHSCENCSVPDFVTGEQVCIRCGVVTREPDNREIYVNNWEGRRMNGDDHHSGNGLLNSETENMDFVSMHSPGLAYRLTNKRGKDFEGKRIKTTLNDAYR